MPARPALVILGGVLAVLVLFAPSAGAHSAALNAKLKKILSEASAQTALSVRDAGSGKTLFEHNAESPLKPASILKIVTSGALLSRFGPERIFFTEALRDAESKGPGPVVYIRGGGDPSFTIEQAWLLVRKLKAAGVVRIGTLALDDSAFNGARDPVGRRAYQTGASALSFNFNSYGFTACPGPKKGAPAFVTVDPPEAAVSLKAAVTTSAGVGQAIDVQTLGPARFKVQGHVGLERSCITVYRSADDPVAMLGETLLALFRAEGVHAPRHFTRGVAPAQAKLIMRHPSPPLKRIIQDLNHFSNNFIGEQLLILLGDTAGEAEDDLFSGRFSRSLGLTRLGEYMERLGIPSSSFSFSDGSGLSHDNRLAARGLHAVLSALEADESVRPEFESSLSVASRSGTLKKREFDPPNALIRAKTGSLDGVSSLAGTIVSRRKRRLSFVIIQNGVASKDKAVQIEDRILQALYESTL